MSDPVWTVKFGPKWKIFKRFNIHNDEHVRQLFYILNRSKACEQCKGSLVRDQSICEECRITNLATQRPILLTECPVCYDVVLDVLENKVNLLCGHQTCKKCTDKIKEYSGNQTWDPFNGLVDVYNVKCPLCRSISTMNIECRLLNYPDVLSYLGVS